MATTRLASELESALAARAPHATDGPGGEAFAGQCLRDAVADANAAIFQAAQDEAGYAGMGTTLVAALFFDDRVANLLTHDHSLLQEQIDSGLLSAEEARHSLNRNLVTRALGVDPLVEVDLAEHLVLPDDLYLLCSDGLNDMVPDEEIALALQTLSGHLELAATQLVEMANDQGGRDNVSVILVKVRQAYPAPGTWWQAFKARFA